MIDVFYRLLALRQAGVQVTLHCFTYGRPEAPELERCCDRVYYYRRNMSLCQHLRRIPFIAASRDNDELVHRLSQDDATVLIEGLHGCELLRRLRQMVLYPHGKSLLFSHRHTYSLRYRTQLLGWESHHSGMRDRKSVV